MYIRPAFLALYLNVSCMEAWTSFASYENRLCSFHLRCRRRLPHVRWQHNVITSEVLLRACIHSTHALLNQSRRWWQGHVRRMDPACGSIPKDLQYGELAEGMQPLGRSRLGVKDICKKDTKLADVAINTWECKADNGKAWMNCETT